LPFRAAPSCHHFAPPFRAACRDGCRDGCWRGRPPGRVVGVDRAGAAAGPAAPARRLVRAAHRIDRSRAATDGSHLDAKRGTGTGPFRRADRERGTGFVSLACVLICRRSGVQDQSARRDEGPAYAGGVSRRPAVPLRRPLRGRSSHHCPHRGVVVPGIEQRSYAARLPTARRAGPIPSAPCRPRGGCAPRRRRNPGRSSRSRQSPWS